MPPYKKYLILSVVFNILSAILNIFSFAALIPILQILFQTSDAATATELMDWDWTNIQAVLMNNMNYYVNQLIEQMGGTIEVQSEVGKGTTFFVTLPCEMMTLEKKVQELN